jgi:hypothetical protein
MKINFAQGAQLWSNDQSGFPEAVQTAQSSDVAIVMVGRSNIMGGQTNEQLLGRYLVARPNAIVDSRDECNYRGNARSI